jgi:hypothetical protein
MLQVGKLVGDLIQTFGFHLSFASGFDCRDYTRRRAAAEVRNGADVSHARRNPL